MIRVKISRPHPGQLFGGRRQKVRYQAGDQIDFITVRDRQNDLSLDNAGFFQYHGAAAGTLDHLDIEMVRDPSQRSGILVDDDHIFVFMGQVPGDMETDLTRTDDYDFQLTHSPETVIQVVGFGFKPSGF
jgi:hypothetical protein